MKNTTIILFGILFCICIFSCKTETKDTSRHTDNTFCNPMNLDYGFKGSGDKARRTSADPVIVLFKDKYYLFATNDRGEFRVSDDLINWKSLPFDPEFVKLAFTTDEWHGSASLAPAVAADENYMYYINFYGPKVTEHENIVDVFRTDDPESGKWEVVSTIRNTADPTLFIDKGRFFVYHGLGAGSPTQVFELDAETMTEIPNSAKNLREKIEDVHTLNAGYYLGGRGISDKTDTGFLIDTPEYDYLPCPEGPWVVENNGKYYLQIATPGTANQWYSDAVFVSDSPTGTFEEMPYNPVSMKAGGFINSAGHSCVFKDKYDNWWQVATMWLGVHQGFERRLGLFPVKFDGEGRMRVYTALGDYPMLVPQHKFDPDKEYLARWFIQSYNKKLTVSSTYENYIPENASDEDIRSWWSAETGNAGEWMVMDLGKETEINALQINFAEQDVVLDTPDETDYHAYKLYISDNGTDWEILLDKSENRKAVPHDYTELDNAVKTRYLKLENVHTPKSGKFAVSDLRVFGKGNGNLPSQVAKTTAVRNPKDERFTKIEWTKADDADGYLVRFGYAPDFLNLCVQVKGGDINTLSNHLLTKGIKYYYRIDAYNGSGITEGNIIDDGLTP